MNLKLTIQYDGARYDGWQRQGNTDSTIQGKLEGVLSRMAGKAVEIHGAGRTDAGVHALGQVASVRLPGTWEPGEVRAYLNRYLPEDIAVTGAERAGERFHARLNAVGKTYRYAIRLGDVPDVFRRKYQLRVEEALDLAAMERAAAALGRRVHAIGILRRGDDLDLTFHGDGFLYHMVRILTGTLLEVGVGKRAPGEMAAILAARDRSAAGPTAPPQGLTLMEVEYP